jgi:hypothetical protein
VPHLIHSLKAEDIQVFTDSIKPTNLGRALELVDNISREAIENGYPEGSDLVLRLNLRICSEHNPPDDINHKY